MVKSVLSASYQLHELPSTRGFPPTSSVSTTKTPRRPCT